MSEHLPECPCVNKSAHPDGCLCCEISSPCICDRLRACEQRVLEQNSRAFDVAVIAHLMKEERAAGLDAAREAVEALRGCLGTDDNGDGTVWVEKADALAVIDELKEKQ